MVIALLFVAGYVACGVLSVRWAGRKFRRQFNPDTGDLLMVVFFCGVLWPIGAPAFAVSFAEGSLVDSWAGQFIFGKADQS